MEFHIVVSCNMIISGSDNANRIGDMKKLQLNLVALKRFPYFCHQTSIFLLNYVLHQCFAILLIEIDHFVD